MSVLPTVEEMMELTASVWGYGRDLKLSTVLTEPRPLGAYRRLYSIDDSDLPRARSPKRPDHPERRFFARPTPYRRRATDLLRRRENDDGCPREFVWLLREWRIEALTGRGFVTGPRDRRREPGV